MKTTLRYLSLNTQANWHREVEEHLKHLHGLAAIAAAEVVLEHQREAKSAFRVQVRLEAPGPGMHAKARDNTLEAALFKSTQDLEHQVRTRQLRCIERGKSKQQLSATSGHWTHAQAGRKA